MAAEPLPTVSLPLLTWFRWYTRRYLRGHFTALRELADGAPPADEGRPLVVYLNHPSWWDPLVCLFLAEHHWPQRRAYAPMSAAGLRRYGFFTRLGFFPVEQGTRAGAVGFLRTATAILSTPGTALWLTPQGRFTDVRERVPLKGGLGHLAGRLDDALFVPLAVEYVFWGERLPEALVGWGRPVDSAELAGLAPDAIGERLGERLAAAQDALAAAAIARDPAPFTPLLAGRVGVGGVYDAWRRAVARVRGKAFDPAHGGRA